MSKIFNTITTTLLATTMVVGSLSAEAKQKLRPTRDSKATADATPAGKTTGTSGKTLWFEGYGLYGVTPFNGAWDSDPSINGNAINQPAAGAVRTYVPGESNKGFGGGLNVGYAFVSGLSGVIGIQISGQSSTKRETRVDNGGTFDVTRTTKTSFTAFSVNLGLRPEKSWGNFSLYGGGGLLALMPMTVTTDEQTAGETVNGARTARLTTDKYNLALGVYGEVGAKYHFGAVSVGAGLRLNVVSTSNNGNTKVQTDTRLAAATTTTTTTISDSFSATQRTAEQAKSAGNTNYDLASPTSVLLSNWQMTLGAAYTLNF